MTESGEHLAPLEIGPPPPEFFDDKTDVLFCMDHDLRIMAHNFNRTNRSKVMHEVGLVDPKHVDEYSPELWDLPTKEFWSRLTTEYADGGFAIDELIGEEDHERWSNKTYEPQTIRHYVTLWGALCDEGIGRQLIGTVDPRAAQHLIESIEGRHTDADYVSRFVLPSVSLPDEVGGNMYSGINDTDINLGVVQEYKLLVPKRTAVVTDSAAIVAEAKAKGYSVIGLGREFEQPIEGKQPDFVVAHPWDIEVNRLVKDDDEYVAPPEPDLLAADGTTEFWVKAFWDQVAHEAKEPRGWGNEIMQRLGFENAIVRESVVSAVVTADVTGEHTDKLPPLALTLIAYDGTPYKGRYEEGCRHETLIGKFARLYGAQGLDDRSKATTGTHLYEDTAGQVFLYIGSENRLHNMVSKTDKHVMFDDGPPKALVEVMKAYGINYIITGDKSGAGFIIDEHGDSREVKTITDEEMQKQMIDRMVEKYALDNGFTENTHPEIWQIYHDELWRHWDNGKAINVAELAASLAP